VPEHYALVDAALHGAQVRAGTVLG